MYCKKCGNELEEDAKFCPKCGTKKEESDVKTEENKKNVKKPKTKIILIIAVIVILLIAIILCIFYQKNISSKQENENTSILGTSNIQANGVSNVSFKNMNADDDNLDDNQKAILDYFDNDYFELYYDINNIQKYPQIFNNAKVSTIGGVVKVLKSTEDEFEVLMFDDGSGYYYGPYPTGEHTLTESNSGLYILKGEQLNERLIEKDFIQIRGRYVGIETREIDGKTYTIPVINAITVNKYNNSESTYNADTIRKVAEYIFGKDIKVTKPDDLNYLVTLDNQSNSNFKAFNMSSLEGLITYNSEYNDLSDSIVKKLFISADFEHYIVTTYDMNLNYAYIEYYDKELNKIWSRQFQYNSKDENNVSPMDYNQNQLAVVIDNDLYLLSLETGENLIEPVLVGKKNKVLMMKDGIFMVGTENKDLIMKVDFQGKILYRIDGDSELTSIYNTRIQIVDGKILLNVMGENANASSDDVDSYYIEKYMVITNDGTVEYSTNDMSSYKG